MKMETLNFRGTKDLKHNLRQAGVKNTNQTCSKHGIKLSKFKDDVYCVYCEKDKIDKKASKQATDIAKHNKTERIFKRFSIYGDEDVKGATFDNFSVTNDELNENKEKAKQIARDYLDKGKKFNSIFTGLAGRGKTHLALSILKAVNEYSKEPQSCLFIDLNQLFREIKESFNYKHSIEADKVDLLSNVDLLVIDDLGSESTFSTQLKPATSWVSNVLFQIFSKRSRTIFTSNLNSKQLYQVYDPKLMSRMFKGLNSDRIIKFTEQTNDYRRIEF